jgi:hypothetical protein
MTVRRSALLLAILVSVSGCASQSKMHAQLGQQVTLEGIAEARKLGAALRGHDFDVWIDQLQDWPSQYVGQKVRVTGVLDERRDLPVFIQKPGEPVAGGIPVPEGTDLHAASRRYVVRDAKWSLIR